MKSNQLNKRNTSQFNAWAKIYDWKIFKWGFRKSYDTVKNNLPNLNGKKMLSIACGTATLEHELAKQFPNARISCIDQSEEMLKRAKDKTKGVSNISFIQGEADKLPFSKNLFDVVICLNAFHHFPDQEVSLQEVYRTLKPGGMFFYADQIKDGVTRQFSAAFNDFFEKGVFHYSMSQLNEFFNRHKLPIVRVEKNLRGALVVGKKR